MKFNPQSQLRASDADRDRTASVLNEALADGRLTTEEHSDRLNAVYAAKTQGELQPLIADVPAPAAARAPVPATDSLPAQTAGSHIVAVLGGATRKGRWHVEPKINIVTVLGGAELDFREALLPEQREIVINHVAVCGGLQIIVPPDMRVVDSGFAVLGGREVDSGDAVSEDPNAPILRITGVAIMGGVEVKHKRRKNKP